MAEHERMLGILLPGSMIDLKRRYRILRYLDRNGRSGRRAMHLALGIPERRLRDDMQSLACAQLVEHRAGGALISDKGRKILTDISDLFPDLVQCCCLEEELERLMPDHRFVIYPDSMESFAEMQTAARITDWRRFLDPEQQTHLQSKEPCCEAGGWILNSRGRPVFHRCVEEEPSMFAADSRTSAEMILSVLRFYKTCGICLQTKAAEALAANLQK